MCSLLLFYCFAAVSFLTAELSAEKVTEMLTPKCNFKSARHVSEQRSCKGKCWISPCRNISTLGRTNDTPVSQLVRFGQSVVMASMKDQNVKPALGHGSIWIKDCAWRQHRSICARAYLCGSNHQSRPIMRSAYVKDRCQRTHRWKCGRKSMGSGNLTAQ